MFKQLAINSAAITMLISSFVFASHDQGSMSVGFVKAVDANTLEGSFSDFLPPALQQIKITVSGVEVPSLKFPKCDKEKDLAVQAMYLLNKTLSTEVPLLIKYSSWDKYGGTIIGKVYQRDVDVGQVLIQNNLAVPFGETRDWCE